MEFRFWLVLGICLVSSSTVVFRHRILRLFKRRESLPPYPVRDQAVADQEIAFLRKLPPSPLTRLRFNEAAALSGSFGTEMERYCNESLSRVLSGDGVNVAVQSLVLSSNELTLVYNFSSAATHLYETGRATIPLHTESGRLLPWMVDKSGRIIEQAKGASMLAVRLAQAWSVVVSAAHIVSGLDVLKRLEEIDRNVSILVAGRRIDQDAQLDRIYTEARGILAGKLYHSSIRDLTRCRYDLYQLRRGWGGEITDLLNRAALSDHSAWHPASWWRRGNRERHVVVGIAPVADKLQRLRFALMVDACLAFASGTTQDLMENALPSEEDLWLPLGKGAALIADRFRKDVQKRQAEELCAGIEAYASILHGMRGQQSAAVDLYR